jgi:ubiquinol-cytochrome c reductase cytochrome b subunit
MSRVRRRRRTRKIASGIDARFGTAKFLKRAMNHIFPDHWSFLLGEMALYSFMILVLTGIFLTFFFKPSLTDMVYHGTYTRLDGVHMSEAYSSVLKISFDVRGGLLIRQIHHWAALLFVGSIFAHMMRIFFSGAFRRPRELNWAIGVTLFILAVVEGFCGYSLPDDLLSGTGIRIAEGIMLSIPVVGTYLVYFFFGGTYPGEIFLERLYIAHVLLIPGLLAALITAHLMAIWHQEHTEWPGPDKTEDKISGEPLYPVFMVKTGALFLFTLAVLALLGTFAQINPIFLYGPYSPASVSELSQPDFYIGFLEGSLRMMPNIVSNVGGYTFAWNVFIPAVLLPIMFVLGLYAYPWVEQYLTGDLRHHHILDRPRNVPARTALGAAVIAMGVILLLAGGDDLISYYFRIPLFMLVWFFRIGFFVFPVATFFITRHLCLAMQARDRARLQLGLGSGIIRQLPDGGYAAVTEPVPQEQRAVIESQPADRLVAPIPRHIVPLPTPRRVGAQVLARLNHFYTRYQRENVTNGHGEGRYENAVTAQQAKDREES